MIILITSVKIPICLFVCCFVVMKPDNPYSASRRGLEVSPWEFIHSDSVALPAVLPNVDHSPEPLYVQSEVTARQVDGLARISGLMQALYKTHPQPPNSAPF